MKDTEKAELLNGMHTLLDDQNADVIVPLLFSIACSVAAQSGVKKEFMFEFAEESINSAYKFFTREDNEVVH